MQVWSIANQKGGVGKTTTSVALSGLAAEAGLRVLMIDLDPHGSLSCYFGKDPDRTTESVFNIFDQRINITPPEIRSILSQTAYKNLSLLPSSTALATLERQAIGDGMGLVISKTIKSLEYDFDLAVVDCPPQLGVLMINAIAACSTLVIPVQTEYLAIKGLERILHTLNMMHKSRKQEFEHLIVPTMFDRRTQASVSSLRTIRNNFGDHVWAGKIAVDTRLRDASKAGVPPHLYDSASRGVQSYRSLFNLLNKNSHVMSRAGGEN